MEGLERGREIGGWGPARNDMETVSEIPENVGKGICIMETGRTWYRVIYRGGTTER